MTIKSIENQELVNLTNCDSEPIHIPGSIQPHGFLLVLNKAYEVKFCSANLPEFNLAIADVLNKKISSCLAPDEAISLIQYLDHGVFESARPHVFTHHDVPFNTTVHLSGGYLLLEFEPFPDGSLELSNLYLQTRKFTTILSQTQGLKHLCQAISEEVKHITGYDRVMIYKFDQAYNGEVFAEARNSDLEPFLGLHYPHTDIPVQARELYLKNLMRMIVDVDYTPVPIVTLDPAASNNQVDLSNSVLRSVSPIHIQYLKNMGVSGTLTISLILDGKLWGLITCHHYSARNIPHYIRLSSLLQGHFLTSQIRVQEVAVVYALKLELDKRLKEFLIRLDELSITEEIGIVSQQLAELTNANGICIVTDEDLQCFGDVPPTVEVEMLISKLSVSKNDFVCSDNVWRDLSLELSNQIAGFLYYKPSDSTHVIWFRNELKKEIHWAGEPDKSVIKDKNGLSPRKSFSVWKEVVTNHSADWQETEITIGRQCIYAIQKHLSFIRDKRIQKTQGILLKKLQHANEELENINWISTHDLKEPLRKINVFASLLLDAEKFTFEDDAARLLTRISSSANKMQKLLADLLSLSRVKSGEHTFEKADLNKLLHTVLSDSDEVLKDQKTTINADGLPEIFCMPVLIEQLFSNLISNAIKFARADVPLIVKIECKEVTNEKTGQTYEITLTDNGKGFENKYNELIFQVFQRLEKTNEVEGTGICLAICKKITTLHRGTITGEGSPGKGAKFTITLPYDPAQVKE